MENEIRRVVDAIRGFAIDCAHNDIRILGNDIGIKSYREGKLPLPEGTIITRIACNYVPSEENNIIFGRPKSFADRGREFFVSHHRTPLVRPTTTKVSNGPGQGQEGSGGGASAAMNQAKPK